LHVFKLASFHTDSSSVQVQYALVWVVSAWASPVMTVGLMQ